MRSVVIYTVEVSWSGRTAGRSAGVSFQIGTGIYPTPRFIQHVGAQASFSLECPVSTTHYPSAAIALIGMTAVVERR